MGAVLVFTVVFCIRFFSAKYFFLIKNQDDDMQFYFRVILESKNNVSQTVLDQLDALMELGRCT